MVSVTPLRVTKPPMFSKRLLVALVSVPPLTVTVLSKSTLPPLAVIVPPALLTVSGSPALNSPISSVPPVASRVAVLVNVGSLVTGAPLFGSVVAMSNWPLVALMVPLLVMAALMVPGPVIVWDAPRVMVFVPVVSKVAPCRFSDPVPPRVISPIARKSEGPKMPFWPMSVPLLVMVPCRLTVLGASLVKVVPVVSVTPLSVVAPPMLKKPLVPVLESVPPLMVTVL